VILHSRGLDNNSQIVESARRIGIRILFPRVGNGVANAVENDSVLFLANLRGTTLNLLAFSVSPDKH
jgi:hypothetical protein